MIRMVGISIVHAPSIEGSEEMPGLTRREFIKGAAGTGAVLLTPLGRLGGSPARAATAYDCIVVGAGFAGLAAAYKLKLLGLRVKLLESRAQAGGICWTETEYGYRFPMGTTYVSAPWGRSAARKIYESLLQTWYQKVPEPFDSFWYNSQLLVDKTIFYNWDQIPGVTAKQSSDCAALSAWFVDMYDKIRWPIYHNKGRALEKYETMTIRQMIASFLPGCDPWVLGCIDSFVRGTFNGNIDEVGGLQGIDMLGDEYAGFAGRAHERGAADGECIVGRYTYCVADLVDVLVAQIGAGAFAYGAAASAVDAGTDLVSVTYTQGGQQFTESAPYCVVATNAVVARSIIQGQPPSVASALNSISYGEYAVVNLVMQSHTVPIHSYDCTLGDGEIDDIYDFTFIKKKRQGIALDTPPGVYGCYIAAKSKGDHTPTLPADQLVTMCLDQLDSMFGAGTRNNVTSTHVARYAQGMPIFHPGLTWLQLTELVPPMNDRILLAGDYVRGSPTVEGALEAGWHAGARIARKLRRGA